MTTDILKERQAWTLAQKIDHALATIDVFISRMGGVDNVYCSFSGGKDSTVLLHLCRILYPDILAVFCSTGNEYPEIIKFVNTQARKGANIHIIRPGITPRQVWDKYGFPLVGKETALKIHKIRTNPKTKTAEMLLGNGYFSLAHKWRFLIDETFDTHNACCDLLKKRPFHKFEKETGRRPIIGVMATESKMRTGQYIRSGGCNVFGEKAASRPLSIWTEADVWQYIEEKGLEIAEIYHKGAARTGCMGCGFGAQFQDDRRFSILFDNHPKCYQMVMDYTNNGVTFREALRKTLAVNGRFLPDEEPKNLFTAPPL